MEAGPSQFEEFAAEARERFARIESRLDLSATKSDLADLRTEMHREFASMTKWVVGTALVLGAAAITIITFVLNYATPPKAPPAPQLIPSTQPPIVIQLPPYPAPRQ
ncbi:hypothetical protein CR105_23380 [Massilia eurypsychrophila]|jgi:hypothetical protein|uniref:Uncharacterized protein n=1 Tax=Massilia eurypsychrophila TaxID=1485217 RepID=A0A2G8T926_9BURK|nr:hypothetical protein [Massilia eurypsychrophila]PIL42557.1 hypothetical protein CR105_23380 [Massilia eurypsychrophila]